MLSPSTRRRLALALLLALYARRSAASARALLVQLALARPPLAPAARLRTAARLTLWGQLIAGAEWLLPALKPALAARIGRSLLWKPPGTVTGVAYGPLPRLALDVYGCSSPRGSSSGSSSRSGSGRPVVVFVHGGAWSFGHRWQYALVGETLARLGALAAVVDYRTFPQGSALDMARDVERAVLWAVDHCRELGGDPARVFLSGHSSGQPSVS